MLKNHFLTAIRNFRKHWSFTIINVVGLTLGMAGSLLIFLWVQDEFRYDRFHTDGERLYQVMYNSTVQGEVRTGGQLPYPMAAALQRDYPEIQKTVRTTYPQSLLFHQQDQSFQERGIYADSNFFATFTFPLVRGETERVLNTPRQIAISESLAYKLFGAEWPQQEVLGKTISVGDNQLFSVSGVFQDVPAYSSLQFDFVISLDKYIRDYPTYRESWGNFQFISYVLLAPQTDVSTFNQKIADTYQRYTQGMFPRQTNQQSSIFLHALTDKHLYGIFENGQAVGGLIQYVRIFSVVAIIVLLLASVNFVNLTTAKSQQRAKEIGVRKAIGAGRWSLALQFLGEALLLTIAATVLALLLAYLLLPFFNTITGKELRLFSSLKAWGWVLPLMVAFTGLLAGAYPSFFLSSLRTVSIMRGKMRFGTGGSTIRESLVVFQFTLSLLIVIGTLAVHWQIRFLQQKDLGIEKDQVLTVWLQGVSPEQYDVVKRELTQQSGVASVSFSSQSPVRITNNTGGVQWPGKSPEENLTFRVLRTDESFLETLNVSIRQGRNFSPAQRTDTANFLINQTAVRAMDLQNPVGRELEYNGQKGRIIGVVQDFHSRSLHSPIDPLLILYQPQYTKLALIKIQAEQTQEILKDVQEVFRTYNPDYPFSYDFLSDRYARLYEREQAIGRLANAFAGLAIAIACLGLYGLAAFTAERRTKEIGIRKALGASVSGILLLLTKDYIKLVAIAAVIAVPIVNYFVRDWLSGFAYRIGMTWWLFLFPVLAVGLIALLSISVQTLQAAVRNPVDSLQHE